MFQVGLSLRSGCPSLSGAQSRSRGKVLMCPAGRVEGLALGHGQETMLLYPGWSLEFKDSVFLFPPVGRGNSPCLMVEIK